MRLLSTSSRFGARLRERMLDKIHRAERYPAIGGEPFAGDVRTCGPCVWDGHERCEAREGGRCDCKPCAAERERLGSPED